MHILAAAAHSGSTAGPVVWIVLVGGLLAVMWFFGWRPLRAKKVSQSAAGATARAAARTTSHAAARARSGKAPAPQPDDAA
jgi:hypothetical protein